MVMRNRHDGANTLEWWDDLPPAMRKRFTTASRTETQGERETVANRRGLVRDLTRLAVLFAIVALANLFFLLFALSFLAGRGPLGR